MDFFFFLACQLPAFQLSALWAFLKLAIKFANAVWILKFYSNYCISMRQFFLDFINSLWYRMPAYHWSAGSTDRHDPHYQLFKHFFFSLSQFLLTHGTYFVIYYYLAIKWHCIHKFSFLNISKIDFFFLNCIS